MYGLTEGGAKRTGRDAAVLPRAVIYDPELSLGLPFADHASSARSTPSPMPPRACTRRTAIRWSTCSPRKASARCAAALPRLQQRPARPRCARRRAGRRLDVRHGHGQRHRRPASQALPHARRQLRPAACGAAHRGAAACPRLQRAGRARGDAEDRRRAAGTGGAGRRVRPRRAARRGDLAAGDRHARRPTSTAPPIWRCRRSIRTRARSSGRRCASCCSAPGKAFVRLRKQRAVGRRAQAVSRFTPFSSQA